MREHCAHGNEMVRLILLAHRHTQTRSPGQGNAKAHSLFRVLSAVRQGETPELEVGMLIVGERRTRHFVSQNSAPVSCILPGSLHSPGEPLTKAYLARTITLNIHLL